MGEPAGYLITFTSYGERMHGDERGTVERLREKGGGTRELGTNVPRERDERRRLVGPPLTLSEAMRTAAARAISDVCLHYGWQLHALNVRTNHVHVVVSGGAPPERMMNAFKAWATRRFRESGLVTPGTKVWTRHGSTQYLWAEPDVVAAAAYVLQGQGPDLSEPSAGAPTASTRTHRSDRQGGATARRPHRGGPDTGACRRHPSRARR